MLACAFPARFRPQPLGEGPELRNLPAVTSLGPPNVVVIAQDGATTTRSLVTRAQMGAEVVAHLPYPVAGHSADGRLRLGRLRHPRFESQAGRWPADLDHHRAERRRPGAADRLAQHDRVPFIGTIRSQDRGLGVKMVDLSIFWANKVYVAGSVFANLRIWRNVQVVVIALTHYGRHRCYRRIQWRSSQPSPSG
jgi:hypothetical protein